MKLPKQETVFTLWFVNTLKLWKGPLFSFSYVFVPASKTLDFIRDTRSSFMVDLNGNYVNFLWLYPNFFRDTNVLMSGKEVTPKARLASSGKNDVINGNELRWIDASQSEPFPTLFVAIHYCPKPHFHPIKSRVYLFTILSFLLPAILSWLRFHFSIISPYSLFFYQYLLYTYIYYLFSITDESGILWSFASFFFFLLFLFFALLTAFFFFKCELLRFYIRIVFSIFSSHNSWNILIMELFW